jgi:hypothetical protein
VASDAWVAIQALWPNINFKANNAKVKAQNVAGPQQETAPEVVGAIKVWYALPDLAVIPAIYVRPPLM